jgi:CheY-like chemotaxis protein
MTPLCLVLSDDLLDASRIVGAGKAAGVNVVQCRDASALLVAIERQPVLVVLDLHNPGLDLEKVVPSLKAVAAKVIAYGSHVDAARLKAARQAGCDEVLPRSVFFATLSTILVR